METGRWLSCTCCGGLLRDTPEENADHGMNSFDAGFGLCRSCEGWIYDITMRPLHKQFRDLLQKPENQVKWDEMSDEQKDTILEQGLEEGVIKWKVGG